MNPNRKFQDPNKIPGRANAEDLSRVGNWPAHEREKMDQAFAAAMAAAGYSLTPPSTYPGTKRPIAGYQRQE